MQNAATDRRSNRSRQPDLATRYYLLNVARRHKPKAVILANLQGEVIAGVEGRPFAETGFIATRASQRVGRAVTEAALEDMRDAHGSRRRWTDRMLSTLRLRRRRPINPALPVGARQSRRVTLGGREMLMVVVGEETEAVIDDALVGLERIMGAPMMSFDGEGTIYEAPACDAPSGEVEALPPSAGLKRPTLH